MPGTGLERGLPATSPADTLIRGVQPPNEENIAPLVRPLPVELCSGICRVSHHGQVSSSVTWAVQVVAAGLLPEVALCNPPALHPPVQAWNSLVASGQKGPQQDYCPATSLHGHVPHAPRPIPEEPPVHGTAGRPPVCSPLPQELTTPQRAGHSRCTQPGYPPPAAPPARAGLLQSQARSSSPHVSRTPPGLGAVMAT